MYKYNNWFLFPEIDDAVIAFPNSLLCTIYVYLKNTCFPRWIWSFEAKTKILKKPLMMKNFEGLIIMGITWGQILKYLNPNFDMNFTVIDKAE